MATATGIAAASTLRIQRQRNPPMNSTNAPPARISKDVPRSGWRTINTKGTPIRIRLTPTCLSWGGKVRLDRYQAMVAGIRIFMNSEGWKRITPGTLIQRVAPMALWPITSTTTSNNTPATYPSGTQRAMNRGSSWAMTTIDNRPRPNEDACLMSRSQLLPLAEYNTNRLPAARVSSRISNGPSMCMRCNKVARLRITSSLERMRSKLLFTGRDLSA
ncbi:MAG: hypothetical protein GAK37_03206 [Pseudomonas sp.]|nr:MAG: hypothetical protein GAK37_03206 [Pseudomonas sp.]